MSGLTLYGLKNCDTCRRAVKWLRAEGVAFEERPIRESPPSPAELNAVLVAHGGDLRKLFNTSGRDYREQKLGEKLPGLSKADAIALLAGNGNLVKRPLLVGRGVALAGFNDAAWAAALAQR
jgi:arsenate reductase (glutaredoxin)